MHCINIYNIQNTFCKVIHCFTMTIIFFIKSPIKALTYIIYEKYNIII